jgi:transcription-repair coupling factor (superfamily II helicase)
MFVVSIDKAGSQIAIKLSENAKVDPDKLMGYLAINRGASFSPSGILRIDVSEDGPIHSAIDALEQIRVV